MVFAQRRFALDIVRTLSSHYADNGPPCGLELDMRSLLHRSTYLPENPLLRFREGQAICTKAKLDLALREETENVAVLPLNFRVQPIRARSSEFGMMTTSVYTVDSLDINAIFSVARNRIWGCRYLWPQFTPSRTDLKLVDSPTKYIQYFASQ
ncbi:Transportin-3 [Phytophthora pseudosyringae]|uniref:Transportin-3 n=1 Tax=Phytophthora pseudosyringae TaxID=221518 RepID=A0A8T1WI92_9STRA|nr:Transportin-3 [Phytophthora pseudosyringae]